MVPAVLIVDDEKHTREGLQQALADTYDVTIAASADTEARIGTDAQITLSGALVTVEAKGMTEAEHAELLKIVSMAARTNSLANALQIPVDAAFDKS